MNDFPPISQLIPHAAPMILVDRVVDWSPGYAACSLVLRSSTRLVEDGQLDAALTVEHMAQTVAVCLGYEAFRGGYGSRFGMIVSCRDIRLHQQSAPVGAELFVAARRVRANPTTSHFDCEVRCADQPVTSGALTLFHGAALAN